ncbi:hypothetical protein VDIAB_100194 [Vibrio diabolicus]|nr:hypothetical protein VDIAB_100194 [Vibrio diabolicus]
MQVDCIEMSLKGKTIDGGPIEPPIITWSTIPAILAESRLLRAPRYIRKGSKYV